MRHTVTEYYELYVGYDPTDDTEYMLTVWHDGTRQVATRPGCGQTNITWSPPIDLPRRDS